jgi:membrane-associated phospholipid phosphatase
MGAGGLINVDRMLGTKFFTTLWGGFNPNHFAAIPSLHGAYPVVIALFARKGIGWSWPLLALYPLAVWFSAVYLNQHYIIDLLIGTGYVVVAYATVSRFLMPKIIEPRLARHALQAPVAASVKASVPDRNG